MYTDAHTMIVISWLDDVLDLQEEYDLPELEAKLEALAGRLQDYVKRYQDLREKQESRQGETEPADPLGQS